jgi:hypothetical protein
MLLALLERRKSSHDRNTSRRVISKASQPAPSASPQHCLTPVIPIATGAWHARNRHPTALFFLEKVSQETLPAGSRNVIACMIQLRCTEERRSLSFCYRIRCAAKPNFMLCPCRQLYPEWLILSNDENSSGRRPFVVPVLPRCPFSELF